MSESGLQLGAIGLAASTPGPSLRLRLIFYGGVPLLTALIFGLNAVGMARFLPEHLAILYWIGISGPLWLLLDGCSRLVHVMLGKWRPHRWLVLLSGCLIAMALFSAYVPLYAHLWQPLLPAGASYAPTPPFPEAFLDLRRFVAYSGVPVYWIGLALFFAQAFDVPGYLAPERRRNQAPGASGVGEGLVALLPAKLGQDVMSLRAEDHYVRVVTPRGSALIRYRFSDALRDVRALPGIQVHRSHWVALGAIQSIGQDGQTYRLRLTDGSDAPVSRSYIGVLRSAGLI